MMSFDGCYDFDGEPITQEEWCALHAARGEGLVRWRVGEDDIGAARVSTVWIGLDLRFDEDSPPRIFETMVFGGPLDQEQERYSTEAQAREGHGRWVALCRAEQAVEAR